MRSNMAHMGATTPPAAAAATLYPPAACSLPLSQARWPALFISCGGLGSMSAWTASAVPLLMALCLGLTPPHAAAQAAAATSASRQNSEALLAFKASMVNGGELLSTWVNGTDYCAWRGVNCDAGGFAESMWVLAAEGRGMAMRGLAMCGCWAPVGACDAVGAWCLWVMRAYGCLLLLWLLGVCGCWALVSAGRLQLGLRCCCWRGCMRREGSVSDTTTSSV